MSNLPHPTNYASLLRIAPTPEPTTLDTACTAAETNWGHATCRKAHQHDLCHWCDYCREWFLYNLDETIEDFSDFLGSRDSMQYLQEIRPNLFPTAGQFFEEEEAERFEELRKQVDTMAREQETRPVAITRATGEAADLAKWLDGEAARYWSAGTSAGKLMAMMIEERAKHVRSLSATTVEEYEARVEAMEDDRYASHDFDYFENGCIL